MFTQRHYVPVLKGRDAEYRALHDLASDVQDGTTPLIEVPPIKIDGESHRPVHSVDAHISKATRQLKAAWNNQKPIFVDLGEMRNSRLADGRHPLDLLSEQAVESALKVVPVTGVGRSTAYQTALSRAAARIGSGVCVRLVDSDLNSGLSRELEAVRASTRVEHDQTDLVVDFGAVSPDAANRTLASARVAVRDLPHLMNWRTLTLISSAFPSTMSAVQPGKITIAPRTDWVIWRSLLAGPGNLLRTPTFGDYAMDRPGFPTLNMKVIKPSAQIRYTSSSEWLLLRSRNVRDHGYEQFCGLCHQIIARTEFRGADFSAGDNFIVSRAGSRNRPGNATTWRWVGFTHHLTFVTKQIATLRAI